MSACCTPSGYRWVFSPERAERDARRYRRRGLDRTSRRVADTVLARGVEGASVLEVGGGAGTVQVELLRAGARQAVSVELTPTYEAAAAGLLRDYGLSDRADRRLGDFAEATDAIEAADIVILNRVVCCYPDMPRLAAAAADRTRALLVLSLPRRTWWTRALLIVTNAVLRVTRREFGLFLHDPSEVSRIAQDHGLRPLVDRRGGLWQVVAFEAAAGRPR